MLNAVPAPPADAPAVVVELDARDPATLLVDWVNELIFRTEVEHTVFTEVESDGDRAGRRRAPAGI